MRHIVCFLLFACLAAFAAMPSTWVKPEGYAYTLSLFAQVLDADGNAITSTGSTLAAFDADGVCRGLKAVRTNAYGVTLYQMSVASNTVDGETLSLKIYDAANDKVLEVEETLDFKQDDVIPSHDGARQPTVFHVRPPFTLPSGWAKPEGYAYTMSLFAQVEGLDGNLIEATGSTLAVFDAYGCCRGLKEVRTNARDVTLYQISISSNVQGETGLTLKIADAATRVIYDIEESLDFEIDTVVPPDGASHPRLFHAKPPCPVQTSLTVSWPDGTEQPLDFAADRGVNDAYATTKDVLSLSDGAYIVGVRDNGSAVNLQTSTLQLKDVTRWRFAVDVAPKSTATIRWWASAVDNRRMWLFPQDGSCFALSMDNAGSTVLRNKGNGPKTFMLTLLCATDDAVAAFELTPGWNLIALPFVPSAADVSSLLAMRPMSLQNNTYAFLETVQPNVGYWIFTDIPGACVLERQPLASSPTFRKGWQVMGVPQAMSELPDGCSAFGWQDGRFTPVETLEAWHGYWVFMP